MTNKLNLIQLLFPVILFHRIWLKNKSLTYVFFMCAVFISIKDQLLIADHLYVNDTITFTSLYEIPSR